MLSPSAEEARNRQKSTSHGLAPLKVKKSPRSLIIVQSGRGHWRRAVRAVASVQWEEHLRRARLRRKESRGAVRTQASRFDLPGLSLDNPRPSCRGRPGRGNRLGDTGFPSKADRGSSVVYPPLRIA